jgi:predicted transcriptional regulator
LPKRIDHFIEMPWCLPVVVQLEKGEFSMNEFEGNTIIYTADIVAAHVSNNSVAVADLPALIAKVYSALARLNAPAPERPQKQEPAVAIRNSVKPDYIICLDDGIKLKMLKRHLMTHHGMTPDEYRAKWGLPASYPMVAPNYAEIRRVLALNIGLGRKPGTGRKPKSKT